MNLELENKVALITGGSKGIGLESALVLAKEGAKVAICGRNEDKLNDAKQYVQEESGIEIHTIVADVSDKAQCEEAVKSTVKQYGTIDILVNNAGTSQAHPFEDVDNDLWEQDLDLKLFGAVNCSKAAIPYMKENKQGSIINVTAAIGKTPPKSSLPTSVSRAAGMALTKAMSKDLGEYNIRVNTVCIGLIRSEQIEKKWQNTNPELSWEEYSKLDRSIPLGRIGDTDEAANVIAFLSSGAAAYVSGTSVNIDGGLIGTL
nr:SDR family oxidoreductase [Mammaliicoccus sp. Marseille-Q6498]